MDNAIRLLHILIRNFKPLAIFCGCTAQFVSDMVENPEDRFFHNEAHMQPASTEIRAHSGQNIRFKSLSRRASARSLCYLYLVTMKLGCGPRFLGA